MEDGAQLAVSIFLPKNREEGQQFPTILHQTRYWRGLDLRWPFQGMTDIGPPSLYIIASCRALVQQGYALVSVDARGSGASTGVRRFEMSPEEIADGKAIMDWIVDQSWSDGNIGSIGISYNGWAAQMLAIHQHPALKCIVPYHAPFDGWQEMSYPGGLFNHYLMNEWSEVCRDLDQNDFPSLTGLAKKVVKGFALVDGQNKKDRKRLVATHASNRYADAFMERLDFRDKGLLSDENASLKTIFPSGHLDAINANPIPVYSFSGWYDMYGAQSAIRQYLNYKHPAGRLVLGPWNHGGAHEVSPFQEESRDIAMDRFGEILRFFDTHLKGLKTGMTEEAAVHYYVMGKEEWKSSRTWPPANVRRQLWYVRSGEEVQLSTIPPKADGSYPPVELVLDTTTYTGDQTRWEIDRSNTTSFDKYHDRSEGKTVMSTPPASTGTTILGYPKAHLQVESNREDASIFLWLEDVAPDGKVRLITQGQLRLRHRNHNQQAAEFADAVRYRSYATADAEPMPIGAVDAVSIHFNPTAWYLEKGHQLRMVVTGSDRDHFSLVGEGPTKIKLHCSRIGASYLELPVVHD